MTRPASGAVLEPTDTAAPPRSRKLGRRARRRTRRRFWFVALPVAALVVAATVVAGEVWREAEPSTPPRAEIPTVAPTLVLPGQTVAFAYQAADGSLPLVGAALVGGVGPHASVVLLDPDTLIEVPAWGEIAVRDLVSRGGAGLLATGVELALGARVDEVALLDDLALSDAIAASAVNGGPRFDQGALLDTTTSASAMDAWLLRLRDETRADQVRKTVPTLSVLVLAALHDATVESLPVDEWGHLDPIAVSRVGGTWPDDTRFGVDGVRVNVELLDGRGDQAMLQEAAACLVHAGASIGSVDDVPAYSFQRTAIIFHDEAQLANAQQMAVGLGTGEVAMRSDGENTFDVTVFIGADFGGCIR